MTRPNDPLDDAIRSHLDREAARVDARAMLERVKGKHPVTRRAWLRWAAGVGTGAAVAAGVGGVLFFNPTAAPQLAAAEQLVEEAKAAHAVPADRHYELVTEWDAPILRKLQIPAVAKRFKVWTRGEQFWVEAQAEGQPFIMGQDAGGRIWFALSRKRGLVYEPTEIGEPLARLCELVSLRAVQTLGDVLEQFTMYRKDKGRPGELIRIEATIRPSFLNRNPRFREIAIDLDPETKLIRRAAFKRQVNGEPAAGLAFTLLGVGDQPADAYDVRGHLDADADVWDRKDRMDRRSKFRDEFLKRFQNRVK
jgi:hypothetical protein